MRSSAQIILKCVVTGLLYCLTELEPPLGLKISHTSNIYYSRAECLQKNTHNNQLEKQTEKYHSIPILSHTRWISKERKNLIKLVYIDFGDLLIWFCLSDTCEWFLHTSSVSPRLKITFCQCVIDESVFLDLEDGQLTKLVIFHVCLSSGGTFNHINPCKISCLWSYCHEIFTIIVADAVRTIWNQLCFLG